MFQWRFPTGHARSIGYVGRCGKMMNYFEGFLRCEYRKCMHNEFWVDLDEWVRKLVLSQSRRVNCGDASG